ncbi:MAG: SCO family protein [Gammaproteobacteria bacterium]
MTGRGMFLCLALSCLASGAAWSHQAGEPEAHRQSEAHGQPESHRGDSKQSGNATGKPAPTSHDEASRGYFTDLVLRDQHGTRRRFYTDVLKDRVVLINFIYTRCRDACPLLTAKLVQVKKALGERFGEQVFFVSISTDPDNDTPEALLEFARQQRADDPGWVFLTGDKADVDRVIKKLGQFNADVKSHSTLILAGNVKTRHWAKVRPTTPAPAIAMQLEAFALDSGT